MPRKKSAKRAAQAFVATSESLTRFARAIDESTLSDQERTWAYEAALIKLAVSFEHLMLAALTCSINNDTALLSDTVGISFPKHLTDEVCEYIVTGGGYFDFKGRPGLLKTIKSLVGDEHYLHVAVKKAKYKAELEQLIALRNYAAHESSKSKQAARTVLGLERLSSAGSYIKRQGRFAALSSQLADLAREIDEQAPY